MLFYYQIYNECNKKLIKNVTFSAFSVLFSKVTDKSSVILSVCR